MCSLPRMGSSDVTKNPVPLRPAIACFLLTACNDVLLFIFVEDNGTSLMMNQMKKALRIYRNKNFVYGFTHTHRQ